MYDKKLAIALTAKDITGKAFDSLQGRIAGITKKVFSLQGAFAATAAAAGMGYFIKKSLDAADAIGKTADRIGVTTDALQEYRHAAELSGIQQSTMDKGLEAFTKRLGEARAGTGALVTYLRSYNETLLENVQSAGSTENALKHIFEAMGNMTSASDKAALSAAAFSRTAGVQMVNMLRDGTDGLNSMLKGARDLGLVIDESLIRNSEKANDALTKVNSIIKTQLTATIVELAPVITDVADQMSGWVKANRELIDQSTHEAIDKITTGLQSIVAVYSALPPGVVGATGAGIVARIISGSTPIGQVTAAMVLLNAQLKAFNLNITSLPGKMSSLSENMGNIWDVITGKKSWRTGVDFEELAGITDSWMGRDLSNAITPEVPDMSALLGGGTQDLWKNFGGAETDGESNWVASAYGFNQPEEWLTPQLDLIESMTSDHFQRMKELTEGSKAEIAEVLTANADHELRIEQTLANQKRQINQAYLSFAASIGNTAIAMTTKQGKTQFALQKSFQVGMAIMDAFLASNNALATMPYPANIGAAAHTLKIGLIGAAAIAAQSIGQMAMGGGGGGGGSVSTGGYSSPSIFPSGMSGTQTEEETKGSLIINIQGDFIGDEGYVEMLAEKISAAVEDRDVTLVASNARTAEQVI